MQKQYRNLTKNEENKTYLDKIHFSHALYSLSTNDTISAKELINASLRTNTKDKILKGLAYETMGNVLFEENQFVLSGAYLDSTLQVLSPRHVHIEKSNAKETSSTTLLTMKPREKRQTAYWF